MFSKMDPGSIRGSILTLVAASCGSGVHVLSYKCVQSGIVLVLGLIMLLGGAIFLSHFVLLIRAERSKAKTYADLAELAGGRPLRLFLIYSILFYIFSSCVGCQIVITQLFVVFCNQIGIGPEITGAVENDLN
mmetsp:Transcript_1729/g.1187  ORF Transcript_1729/g.1187 Transcript_1729/m.1187 type:complete len:133 (+) Transcript_1729:176-574(+)